MPLEGIDHIYQDDPQAIAFTSLVKRGDTLWCGQTGGRYCLVPFDLKSKQFGEAIDIFPWVADEPQVVLRKIHNGMGLLDDGRLVIGEGILFSWDGIPFKLNDDPSSSVSQRRREKVGAGPLPLDKVEPADLSTYDMRWLTGGKLQIFDPDTGVITPVGQIQPFNYVQSLVVDPKTHRAYGHTLGDCHFFVADLDTGEVEDHGKISRFAFHNLVIAPDGVVFGAWIDGHCAEKLRVLRFDPARGYLERLDTPYLDDPGPKVHGNQGLDQWLVHSSGDIYVGMAGDGMLYKFDPASLALTPIGIAGEGGRVTTLDEDDQGRVIFTGGLPLMHVGRFDPASGKLEDLGPITDKYEQVYFHGSAIDDGNLYLAETDSGIATLWEVPLPE